MQLEKGLRDVSGEWLEVWQGQPKKTLSRGTLTHTDKEEKDGGCQGEKCILLWVFVQLTVLRLYFWVGRFSWAFILSFKNWASYTCSNS